MVDKAGDDRMGVECLASLTAGKFHEARIAPVVLRVVQKMLRQQAQQVELTDLDPLLDNLGGKFFQG